MRGERAHTARAWMGRNAIHRLGAVLVALEHHTPRRPLVDGLRFHEALQAVAVDGGVAGNVVPDSANVVINVRFAPDRSARQAEADARSVLAPYLDAEDTIELLDAAEGARPAIGHPLLAPLLDELGLTVNPKLGWTDVARFTRRGVPAVNLGPGDPTLAHTAAEHVDRRELDQAYAVLRHLACRPTATL
jgi:succinyl-diaminopimelate desuccinylase